MLALVLAMLLAIGAAGPAFADEATTTEDGTVLQPRIVGGKYVPDGKYKFIAALRDVTRGNSAYQQQFCGGALIDRDSVLTAAHCVKAGEVTARQLRVSVGVTSLREPRQGQMRSVTAITRHPLYLPTGDDYDAAVLTLSRPVRKIAPVTIPDPNSNGLETPDRMATIAGWGNTEKQGPELQQPDSYPFRMQETQVPIVSDADAENAYGNLYEPPLMLAAGREGKDTCQGDSGGPIFVKKPSGRVFQIGITSFGTGCGLSNSPSVYAEANNEEIMEFIYLAAAN